MRLLLATRNPDKLRELEDLLSDMGLSLLSLLDFPDSPVVVEDGKTLEDNAAKKAQTASARCHVMSLGEDSGLEVDFLEGAPGVLSARFAGEGVSYRENNEKLLSLLRGVPLEKRGATFRCVTALSEPGGELITFEGTCSGYISTQPKGDSGFGYDPLFVLSELGKTFAEIGRERKNQLSHRARALAKVKEYLRSRL